MVKRDAWLSITPEPERELPRVVATLIHRGSPPAETVVQEQAKIERLVLRGSQRQWLAYLDGVLELIELRRGDLNADVTSARARAIAVLGNHHNLLLGLPGSAAQRTAAARTWLDRIAENNNEHEGPPDEHYHRY